MKKKNKELKNFSLLLILLCCLFVTGCGKTEEETTYNEEDAVVFRDSILDDIDASGSGKLYCTRAAFASDGIDVELTYELEYKEGNVTLLHSNEKVMSEDSDSLDEYEDAYRGIAKNYEGLKYYDIIVTRDDSSVVYNAVINYEKLDMDKLLDIEGEEDNIVTDGKVKLETWVSFAEQFGTTCEEAQ